MNNTDMSNLGSGRRWCMMRNYGEQGKDPADAKRVNEIIKAWGATAQFDIDNFQNDKPNAVTNNTSRHFLLLFDDGLWRQASFGGLNGPPCASCCAEGIRAPTGRIAWLVMCVHRTQDTMHRTEAAAKEAKAAYEEAQADAKKAWAEYEKTKGAAKP